MSSLSLDRAEAFMCEASLHGAGSCLFYGESRSSAGRQEKFMKRSSRPPPEAVPIQLPHEKWIRARQGAGK